MKLFLVGKEEPIFITREVPNAQYPIFKSRHPEGPLIEILDAVRECLLADEELSEGHHIPEMPEADVLH